MLIAIRGDALSYSQNERDNNVYSQKPFAEAGQVCRLSTYGPFQPARFPQKAFVFSGEPMKLLKVLSRPIAFHRCLAELTGSVTSGLMLSQALYWTEKTKDSDGWFWKTQDEWFDETMLSRKEQETARRRLKELGDGKVWFEQLRGVPAKLYYRVDLDALEALLLGNQDETIGHSSMPERDILDRPNRADKSAPIGQAFITEITSEITPGEQDTDPATSSPSSSKPPINDLGEILEDAYPGHATNWKTMRELRDLVNRVDGTRSDVLAFPEWLKRTYPKKANSPFAFKDLFPEMVKEINATKPKAATSHCGECNNGWMLIDDTAKRCHCQTKTLATA
jgi:hypothetical protein